MGILEFIKNLFKPEKKKYKRRRKSPKRRKRKIKWYTSPHIPNWTYKILMSQSGPEDYYLGDDIVTVIKKYTKGTKYKIIKKGEKYLIIPKQRISKKRKR